MSGEPIKIIDYRNARYQGQMRDGRFHGLGILLHDDLTFCLALWSDQLFSGPAFIVLPDEKIFYGEFKSGHFSGFCCFHIGPECQIYCLADNGSIISPIAAVFPLISSVIELPLDSDQQVKTSEEALFQDESDKWSMINRILNISVPKEYQTLRRFVKHKLVEGSPNLEESFGKDYSVGYKNGGIRVTIGTDGEFKEAGIYNESNILCSIGKKMINREQRVREEGLYDELNGLERYQERPKTLNKKYRDFFRKSLCFENKFVSLRKVEEIKRYINQFTINITDNTTNRIAQQLLENPNPPKPDLRTLRSNNTTRGGEIKDKTVSIQKLKEELNKTINNKSRDRSRSPYRDIDTSPADLKYTSNRIAQTILEESRIEHQKKSPAPYQRPAKPEAREQSREYNQPSLRVERSYRNLQRSPPPDYQSREEENPQRKQERKYEKFPEHIYANIKLSERRVSPVKHTPKLEKMSDMYDNIQREDKARSRNQFSGKNYHLHDQDDMYTRKMGLVQASRKVQYEPSRRSPSPIRPEPYMPYSRKRSPYHERTAGYTHYADYR